MLCRRINYCWKTEKQNEHVRMNCCNVRGVQQHFTIYVAGHGCTSIKSSAVVKVQCCWSKEKVVIFDKIYAANFMDGTPSKISVAINLQYC